MTLRTPLYDLPHAWPCLLRYEGCEGKGLCPLKAHKHSWRKVFVAMHTHAEHAGT